LSDDGASDSTALEPTTDFVVGSDLIMLFCPLLDDLILTKIGVVGEKCGLTVLVLVNVQ